MSRACPRLVAALALGVLGCGGHAPAAQPPPAAPAASAAPAPTPPAARAEVLGPRPETPTPPPFLPPAPEVFTATNGITVWLLERHQVPVVSCGITVPTGAASDPRGKGGLAYATASMLDEGAGTRGAIDLARAIDDLGARLDTDADADASVVTVTVLKRNLERAFAIFGDVVVRPRFEPKEFKRFGELWQNALLEREKDPDATARVVYRVTLFGADHPYGHPSDGTTKTAKAISLDDVRRFYRAAWRPDRATLVCAGDITRQELTAMSDAAFATWKSPATPAPAPVVPAAPSGPWPKLVLVDRPDAPQAVIAVVKPGLAASSPEEPALWRVNAAIGGTFSSRLMQDLREQHGYTYGARSRYSVSRGPGMVASWANVVTDKTGDALGAMLGDLSKFAADGMTDAEVESTRSQARGDMVSVYESVEGIAGHLVADAGLGLGADYEAKAAKARDAARKPELDALAKRFYDPAGGIVVVVGPRARVQPMIDKLGLPAPEMRDSEGAPLR